MDKTLTKSLTKSLTKPMTENQQIKFIYNAIEDGWVVKKIYDKQTYELTKSKKKINKEIKLEECLKKFIAKTK
tara:strand:- start:380 stop:598 length:219 start_codon:yes stop_codon:yes gene_type:complete